MRCILCVLVYCCALLLVSCGDSEAKAKAAEEARAAEQKKHEVKGVTDTENSKEAEPDLDD